MFVSKINGARVTRIGAAAFFNCTNVTGVIIPEGVTSIGNFAFRECRAMVDVALPSTITSLGAGAFSRCVSLADINLPGSVADWPVVTSNSYGISISGSWAFAECTNLTSLTLGDGISTVPPYAFSGCLHLTGVLLPNSVTTIGNGAFEDCQDLPNLSLPGTVASLGAYAFWRCAGLTNIFVPGSITQWPLVSEVTGPYPLPPALGSWAFRDCTNLTTVTIGSGVSSIPPYAFLGCVGLNTVLLPNSVVRIGNGAFENCRSLTALTIPNSAKRLGALAFAGCTSLTSITIPGAITTWDAITIEAYYVGSPVYMFFPSFTYSSTFGGCTSLRTVVVENGVSTIPAGAFTGCSALRGITIPGSVTTLGTAPASNWPYDGVGSCPAVFSRCTNLTGIYFEGNPPRLLSPLIDAAATVYYLQGAGGWGATYGGCPTALWLPQIPASGLGVPTDQFSFTVAWARDRLVAVEVCTDLLNPVWSTLQTLTLTGGSATFRDSECTNYPARFYRLRAL